MKYTICKPVLDLFDLRSYCPLQTYYEYVPWKPFTKSSIKCLCFVLQRYEGDMKKCEQVKNLFESIVPQWWWTWDIFPLLECRHFVTDISQFQSLLILLQATSHWRIANKISIHCFYSCIYFTNKKLISLGIW